MIGYPSGQDGVILPARDCPFCSCNNISPKSKRVHESFLSQNIFRDSKKIFCDFSVGMELENEKTETRYHFCIWLASFSVLENKQVRRSFFKCYLCADQTETSTSPPRAFELLKTGSFKFPPPRAKMVFKCPTLTSDFV